MSLYTSQYQSFSKEYVSHTHICDLGGGGVTHPKTEVGACVKITQVIAHCRECLA
jgi:hypothetical protein